MEKQESAVKFIRIFVAIAVLALAGKASGQTVTIIYQFGGGNAFPNNLIQGSDGNFYGTTYLDGTANDGAVFRMTPGGILTNLYSFTGLSGDGDGAYPWAGLIQAKDGNFYGTTSDGGLGNGTVFRISPAGKLTNFYLFGSTRYGGGIPIAPLAQGTDGNFYGTTDKGGTSGHGAIFRISPSGVYTTLYSFAGPPTDGGNPAAGLVQGTDGNFYGTTQGGQSAGAVFRISPAGNYTNLHTFLGYGDGGDPVAGLVEGTNGSLYGTTLGGTVYEITPSGTLTVLYSVIVSNLDGPQAPLVLASDGNFYGTTYSGGTSTNCPGCGTIFRVSPSGVITTIYNFAGTPNDGSLPEAAIVQGSDGNLYGTTEGGGTNGYGTIFRLSVPLNPPANQISSTLVDSSGTNVVFSIPSVAGETYQLQFSPSMNPTNWSNVAGVCVSNSIGAALTVTNFGGATGPQGFYRFAITP